MPFRITPMNGVYYAVKFEYVDEEVENIEGLLEGDDIVILCNDLEQLQRLDIDYSEIKMVE